MELMWLEKSFNVLMFFIFNDVLRTAVVILSFLAASTADCLCSINLYIEIALFEISLALASKFLSIQIKTTNANVIIIII